LSQKISKKYDLNIINKILKLKGKIVGIIEDGDGFVILPSSTLKTLTKWVMKRNRIAVIDYLKDTVIKKTEMVESGKNYILSEKGKSLKLYKQLREQNIDVSCKKSETEQNKKEFFNQIKVVKTVLYSIAGIILFFSFLFVWSTVSRVVGDSKKEIGVFRSVGATKKDILKIFLAEAYFISFISSVTGIIIGQIIAYSGSKMIINYFKKKSPDVTGIPETLYGLDLFNLIILIAACSVIGMLAGLSPAYKASKIDPVEILKSD